MTEAVDNSGTVQAELGRGRLLTAFGLAVAVSVGLGFVPWGRKVVYPFALFGTWAHEMGHGLGGLITGNRLS